MKRRSNLAVCGVWCVLATLGGCVPGVMEVADTSGGPSGAAGGGGSAKSGGGGDASEAGGGGGVTTMSASGGGGQSTGSGGNGEAGSGVAGGAGGGSSQGGAGGAGGGMGATLETWEDGVTVKVVLQIAPGATTGATVRCPVSHPIPMAGGFATPHSALRVLASQPVQWLNPGSWTDEDPEKRAGWRAGFKNTDNMAPLTFEVYIACRMGTPPPTGSISEGTAAMNIQQAGDVGATAKSAPGKVPWGGGFQLDGEAMLHLSAPTDSWAHPGSWNADPAGWGASAYSPTANGIFVRMVYGEVGPVSPYDDIKKIQITELLEHGGKHPIASCPISHPVPVTGGAEGSSSSFNILQSFPEGWEKPSAWSTASGTGARWHAAMDNYGTSYQLARAVIVCRALRADETLPPRKLRSKSAPCPMSGDNVPVLAAGDWNGDLEVWGNKVYLAKGGKLFAGEVGAAADALAEIASSENWNGDVELFGGYIYVARDAQLYGAKLSDDGLGIDDPLTLISDLGPWGDRWAGDIEIGGGYIYLAKSGNLWRAQIDGLQVFLGPNDPASTPNGLELFNGGGWVVDYEISDGMMYLLAGDKLYSAALGEPLESCGDIPPGDLEVSGGVLYVASPE